MNMLGAAGGDVIPGSRMRAKPTRASSKPPNSSHKQLVHHNAQTKHDEIDWQQEAAQFLQSISSGDAWSDQP